MGYVYHSNFLAYFEIGRTDYFREIGFTYKNLEADQVFMPVVECSCKFLSPAHYDDELEIHTEMEMLSRLKIQFRYDVFRARDLLVQGSTTHVPVNREGKPCKI